MGPGDYLDLFVHQWESALSRTQKSLDRHDMRKIHEIKDFSSAIRELQKLQEAHSNNAAISEAAMLAPSLQQLDRFSNKFTELMESRISVAIFWGLLLLIIKLCIGSADALFRVSRMLKVLGHKAELFNGYSKHASEEDLAREVALEVFTGMIAFFTEIIKFFRGQAFDESKEESWHDLIQTYKATIEAIDEAFDRIDRMAQLSKINSHIEQLRKLQDILSIGESADAEAKLPCVILPAVRITRFYDRDEVIQKIDVHLKSPRSDDSEARSIALYGLGGVGKSQTALKFASRKKREYQAILWMHSATPTAIAQSFTEAAIALSLQGAKPQLHSENRVLVLSWLQRTGEISQTPPQDLAKVIGIRAAANWLLIFDNVEDSSLIAEYWPVASQGSIIITTRNPSLSFDPAEAGIEIPHFDLEEGAGFVLHLLSVDIANDLTSTELKSAQDLSDRLSGHALAIAQMAGLIHKRCWTIEDFVKMYDENTRKILTSSGRHSSLDTVWKLSFESLDDDSFVLLGVFSLLAPDLIPQALFEVGDNVELLPRLDFCKDVFDFSEVLDPLFGLSLVRKDKDTRNFSIHRLVQAQFRYHMSSKQNQESFEHAALLLFHAFPQKSRMGQMYHRWATCQMYVQHVLSLANWYRKESKGVVKLTPTLPFLQVLANCGRYLSETGAYVELANLLEILQDAYDLWDQKEHHPLLLATILISTSTMWLERGRFDLSERQLLQVLKLQETHAPDDSNLRAIPLNNIGNAALSANKAEEALRWYEELEGIDEEDDPMAPDALTQLNLGRALWFMGRHSNALEKYKTAMDRFESSENWAMMAFTYYAYGNASRKDGKFTEARKYYQTALDTWTSHGNSRIHSFPGACHYKLGCVELDLGNLEVCIQHLENALAIATVRKDQLVGDYTRALIKLSNAIDTLSTVQKRRNKRKEEAERLYREFCGLEHHDELQITEEMYDNLICCLWR